MSIETEIKRLQTAKENIKSAIEEKGVTVGDGTIDTYAEKIGEIIVGGGNAEDNPFYYATSFSGAFYGSTFPDNYDFVLKVRKAPANMANAFMRSTGVKTIKLISEDNSNIIDANACFREVKTIETVDLSEYNCKVKAGQYMFFQASSLKSIYGALDFTDCANTTQWLNGAPLLEDIEFVPNTIKISTPFNWCSKLTKTSITSAINGLDNIVTGQTITLSKTAVNNAFGIDVDDESTYTEEFNTLRNAKSNWTFAYV